MSWIRGVSLLLLLLAAVAAQEIKFPTALASRATESVDVSLDGNMLQLASKFLSGSKPDEGQAKKLIANLKAIYVKAYEFDKPGQYSDADIESVRAQVRGAPWTRIVSAQSKKGGETAEIYIKTEKDVIAGLLIIAAEPKELTFVHILGPIDPEQIANLSGKFGIPKLNLTPGQKEAPTKKKD
jgi:Domain of unknown function (DUF4252)